MKKLKSSLESWVKAGLISQDQSEKIIEFEDQKGVGNWLVYSFMVLGVLVIVSGIISLIAANWQFIPSWAKLQINFLVYALLIFGMVKVYQRKNELVFEIGLIFLSLYAMGTIALVSQIYHTGGELYHAALFWSLLHFGFLLLTRKEFFPYLWSGIFFTSLIYFCWDNQTIRELYHRNVLPIFQALPFLSIYFVLIFKKIKGEGAVTKVFRQMGFACGVMGIFIIESRVGHLWQKAYVLSAHLLPYLIIASVVFFLSRDDHYSKGERRLLMSLIGLYVFFLHFPLFGWNSRFLIPLGTIAILFLAAIYMVKINYKKMFDTFVILIFLRFLAIFFEAFAGLARTGIGLIISGLIILGTVYFWHKKKTRLSEWAKELIQ